MITKYDISRTIGDKKHTQRQANNQKQKNFKDQFL